MLLHNSLNLGDIFPLQFLLYAIIAYKTAPSNWYLLQQAAQSLSVIFKSFFKRREKKLCRNFDTISYTSFPSMFGHARKWHISMHTLYSESNLNVLRRRAHIPVINVCALARTKGVCVCEVGVLYKQMPYLMHSLTFCHLTACCIQDLILPDLIYSHKHQNQYLILLPIPFLNFRNFSTFWKITTLTDSNHKQPSTSSTVHWQVLLHKHHHNQ